MVCKNRKERMQAIGDAVAGSDYDIVALQEVTLAVFVRCYVKDNISYKYRPANLKRYHYTITYFGELKLKSTFEHLSLFIFYLFYSSLIQFIPTWQSYIHLQLTSLSTTF